MGTDTELTNLERQSLREWEAAGPRARQAVLNGARLLSRVWGGHRRRWLRKVDANRYDVGRCDRCTLGQIYGTYSAGLHVVFGESLEQLDVDRAVGHGFLPDRDHGVPASRLNRAWRAFIRLGGQVPR